jgi:hypothetical protein
MTEPETPQVFRVFWIPGTDFLRATCHCAAERIFDDPIELWTWLLDHPRGHDIGGPAEPAPDAVHPEGQLSEALR